MRKRPLNIREDAGVDLKSGLLGHWDCFSFSLFALGDLIKEVDDVVDLKFSLITWFISLKPSVLYKSAYGGFPCVFSGERKDLRIIAQSSFDSDFVWRSEDLYHVEVI